MAAVSMTIGELSRRSGLASSKIRFYERIGLLKMVSRQANGYRTYPPEVLTTLNLISTAQRAGFSLDELKKLLPEDLSVWNHDELLSAIENKLRDVDSLIATLNASRNQLAGVLAAMAERPHDVTCADNARKIISAQVGAG